MSVRRGEHKGEDLLQLVDNLHQQVEEKKHLLPKETDPEPLNRWLVQLRVSHLKSEHAGRAPTPLPGTNMILKKEAEDLMQRHSVKGTVLAVVPSGSHAYGVPCKEFIFILLILLGSNSTKGE